MTDLSAFGHHEKMAAKVSRPDPVFIRCRREWREGLDHARGDRLPYEPHLVRFDRPTTQNLAGIPLAQSPTDKIPAMLDPKWSGRQAALRAIRVRCGC